MNNLIYILLCALTVFLIRSLPILFIRKPIKNRFIKSFLYYVPYVTLAIMSFPAIIDSTSKPISGLLALVIGIIASYKGLDLFVVTVLCCLSALIIEIL